MRPRAARPDEAEALSQLAFASKGHWGYSTAQLELWRANLEFSAESIRRFPTFVIDIGGMPAGVIQIATDRQPWELDALWVHPQHQRRGIGRALMAHALALARAQGQRQLAIDADPNAALFYRACGARPAGELPAPIDGQPQRVRPQFVIEVGSGA